MCVKTKSRLEGRSQLTRCRLLRMLSMCVDDRSVLHIEAVGTQITLANLVVKNT